MGKNTIFVSIDNNFYDLLIEFLKNIKNNYKNHPLIHIIHTNLNKNQELKSFLINNNIKFIKNDIGEEIVWPIMLHLENNYDPRVFYARFMIWNNYFRSFDKILHLDVDMLILKPLDYIFEKDDFFIVEDVYEWHDFIDINDIKLIKQLKKDNISVPKCSNAGMFLITKKYLTDDYLNSLIEIKNSYKDFIRFADQSIINIFLFKNNIKIENDFKSNFQYRLLFVNFLDIYWILDTKILHFNWLSKNKKLIFMKIFKNIYLFKVSLLINKLTKWKLLKYFF